MLSSVTDEEPPTRQVARKSTAKPARNLALQWAYKRKNENEESRLELSMSESESVASEFSPVHKSVFSSMLSQRPTFLRPASPSRQGGKDPYRRNALDNFRNERTHQQMCTSRSNGKQMIRMQPLEQSMSESESAASDCESDVPTGNLLIPVTGQRVSGKLNQVKSLSESETSVRIPMPSTSSSSQRCTGAKSPQRLNGKQMIKKSIEAPPEKINFKQYRPGLLALKEIKYYQRISNLLIPKRNFQRLVREVMQKYKSDYCINVAALSALQEASEAFIVELFEKVNLAAIHASRVTITTRDLDLARRIGGYEFSRNLNNVGAKY